MALDGTYAGLTTSVGDFLNRADLTSSIPDFVKLAEAELNRRLRVADMITSTTLVVNTSSVPLPADFNGMVAFELPASTGTPLRYVRPEEARALKQTLYAATGTPQMFTIVGNNLETVPPPGQSYTCSMVYYARLVSITGGVANWMLLKHPDLYLYGSLMQSAPYLKDDGRVPVWGALFEKAISELTASDGRAAFGHALQAPYRGAAQPPGTDPQP